VKTSQVEATPTVQSPEASAMSILLEQTKLENAKSLALRMLICYYVIIVVMSLTPSYSLVAITEIKTTLRYNLQQITLKNPPIENVTNLSKLMNSVKAELISLSTVIFLNDFKVCDSVIYI
jgi:hypothetical protein